MEDREWRDLMDKTAWGSGPWQQEPDKVQWTDPRTGFACLIVRNEVGSLCGYVGVPEGHPWHGMSCWDLSELNSIPVTLDYSNECAGDPEGPTICHVAAAGEPETLWWLGFHCSHAFDLSPALLALPILLPERLFKNQTYRPIEYVKATCTVLALEAEHAASPV
jgi:hypothetical protein